ncbi:MAG TPA: carboxylating nicotinate-nucleotide diphosphorylase [Nitrospira sp.]|nr:carboxylating nicotinate-nucleotide diphosphorylase [Nitrospira sp.]
MPLLPAAEIRRAVRQGLEEDAWQGDVTTAALFLHPTPAQGRIIAQQDVIVAGIAAAVQTFLAVDASLALTVLKKDGSRATAGDTLLRIEGDGRSILTAERTALNFLQHLSGIATLADRFCQAVRGYRVVILDTRKTLPGWRKMQKWAVALGGGTNHRSSLGDAVLVKDNHLSLLSGKGAVRQACELAKSRSHSRMPIIVEVESLRDVLQALTAGADIILLDNMTPTMVRKAVRMIKGRALVEVSGGITLKNVRAMAAAGANRISIGALTHSAPAAAMTLELEPARPTRKRPR